jgi:hypothetical protein
MFRVANAAIAAFCRALLVLLAVYGRARLCKGINVPADGSLAIVYPAFGAAGSDRWP